MHQFTFGHLALAAYCDLKSLINLLVEETSQIKKYMRRLRGAKHGLIRIRVFKHVKQGKS